jgi:hypothetical protein
MTPFALERPYDRRSRAAGVAVTAWGMVGVSAIFAESILRLGARAARSVDALDARQWLSLVAVTSALVYVEGHRALQKRLAPRMVSRALTLGRAASLRDAILAPLSLLSLVGSERRELARAWSGVGAIVAAALIVRALPEPWRSIIDGAVAAALLWGLVALWIEFATRLRSSRSAF